MRMLCMEGAQVPGKKLDWDLTVWGGGELTIDLPFEYADLGEDYYEGGGQNGLFVSITDVVEEYTNNFNQIDDQADELADELIRLGNQLKQRIKGEQ